jgi:hypothetical protein
MELVYRGQVFYGEGVPVFPGGVQRFEDRREQISATVVVADRSV